MRRTTSVILFVLLVAFSRSAPPRTALTLQRVLVVSVDRIEDTNGDLDGQLDTNESGELVLRIANKSQSPISNLTLRLTAADPKIDSIGNFEQFVLAIPAGGEVVTAPFLLHVSAAADRNSAAVVCQSPGPAGTCSNFVVVPGGCNTDADCRRTPLESYTTNVRLTILGIPHHADGRPLFSEVPSEVALQLDLNLPTAAAATTTFEEGFESGFGNFTLQNLDANLASNSASNGARCQFTDPDYPSSETYGETECYLGFATGQAPLNDWHVHTSSAPDGGRASTGIRSLHYGAHTSANPALDTYGLSQLDAIRTKVNINLATRICRDDVAVNPKSCNSAMDCVPVGAGPCVAAAPQLSFRHQASLKDSRGPAESLGQSTDRAVVAVQRDATGPWEKIFPTKNVYNAVARDSSGWCLFDPIDDGNSEDDYFDPSDPARTYGPSSTCYPEFVFSDLGDTSAPFSPGSIGEASDGPGLAGAVGPGTWVESTFDLSRYRGRSVRIRFLFTLMKIGTISTWEAGVMWNPVSYDDGWYIDDVQVSQTTGATSSTVALDTASNSSLPGGVNADADGRPDSFDCAPSDAAAFAVPPEVVELRWVAGPALSWESAAALAGSGTVYDVLRGKLTELPVGTGPSETCVASGAAGTTAPDPGAPSSGQGFFYLVRARHACASGIYGHASDGAPRASAACP